MRHRVAIHSTLPDVDEVEGPPCVLGTAKRAAAIAIPSKILRVGHHYSTRSSADDEEF